MINVIGLTHPLLGWCYIYIYIPPKIFCLVTCVWGDKCPVCTHSILGIVWEYIWNGKELAPFW